MWHHSISNAEKENIDNFPFDANSEIKRMKENIGNLTPLKPYFFYPYAENKGKAHCMGAI